MLYYRLYFMSPASGHIERFQEIESESDEAALVIVRALCNEQPMELWRGHTKVGRYEPGGSATIARPPVVTDETVTLKIVA
jgi:hypothetical protein